MKEITLLKGESTYLRGYVQAKADDTLLNTYNYTGTWYHRKESEEYFTVASGTYTTCANHSAKCRFDVYDDGKMKVENLKSVGTTTYVYYVKWKSSTIADCEHEYKINLKETNDLIYTCSDTVEYDGPEESTFLPYIENGNYSFLNYKPNCSTIPPTKYEFTFTCKITDNNGDVHTSGTWYLDDTKIESSKSVTASTIGQSATNETNVFNAQVKTDGTLFCSTNDVYRHEDAKFTLKWVSDKLSTCSKTIYCIITTYYNVPVIERWGNTFAINTSGITFFIKFNDGSLLTNSEYDNLSVYFVDDNNKTFNCEFSVVEESSLDRVTVSSIIDSSGKTPSDYYTGDGKTHTFTGYIKYGGCEMYSATSTYEFEKAEEVETTVTTDVSILFKFNGSFDVSQYDWNFTAVVTDTKGQELGSLDNNISDPGNGTWYTYIIPNCTLHKSATHYLKMTFSAIGLEADKSFGVSTSITGLYDAGGTNGKTEFGTLYYSVTFVTGNMPDEPEIEMTITFT